MNGGGCTGAVAAAAAAAATNSSSNLVTPGTSTRKKRPPTTDETRAEAKKQRHHHHLQVVLGKRKYESSEFEVDHYCRENDKMFKCNYWEDPAYAKKLQRDGLQRARIAALDNQIERLLMHEPAPDAPQQPEPPAGASDDPPITVSCPDRYRRFDHDYC